MAISELKNINPVLQEVHEVITGLSWNPVTEDDDIVACLQSYTNLSSNDKEGQT